MVKLAVILKQKRPQHQVRMAGAGGRCSKPPALHMGMSFHLGLKLQSHLVAARMPASGELFL